MDPSPPPSAGGAALPRSAGDAQRGQKSAMVWCENQPQLVGPATSTKQETETVRVPAGLPSLTRPACRALLAILIELTEVVVLDGPSGKGME